MKKTSKEKSVKLSKNEFLKLCASLYADAKKENAGIIHLHCLVNEKKQGVLIECNSFPNNVELNRV